MPDADKIFNAKNNLIFPGFIDVHTHMRDSTLEYKENFVTGTSAAVAGGFTTIFSYLVVEKRHLRGIYSDIETSLSAIFNDIVALCSTYLP